MEEEKESGNKNDQTQGQSAIVDPQTRSLLFQRLPQELRDYIYMLLFSNTRIMNNNARWYWSSKGTVRPVPNSLALLVVCRRARFEIGKSWLHYVLFWYGCGEEMLERLSGLPVDILSQIRHIRVTGTQIQAQGFPGPFPAYPLVSTLKLLPGLRLDQLTVLDFTLNGKEYEILSSLIAEGNGWKTLRYVCRSSEMLGFSFRASNLSDPKCRYWRKPEPMHWQTIIERRDGTASNPSVTIYRSKARRGRWYPNLSPYSPIMNELRIFDPSKRDKFEQKPWEGPYWGQDMVPSDPELMTEREGSKDMLIIVKRGAGADYEERKDSPFAEMDPDWRRDFPGMTWRQIRAKHIDRAGYMSQLVDDDDDDDDDDGDDADDDDADVDEKYIVDRYEDVDEYP